MSTYRKLHGRAIQAVTTDPTESVAEGQVWYNTTSDTFKSVVSSSAWSSGSSLTTGRNRAMGAGTNTAAVTAGGYAGSPTSSNLTEEYNGSGWSAANNMATGSRGAMSAGTQTAALTAGGLTAPYPAGGTNVVSQTYDGTNWTNTPSPNTINTGRANIFIGTAGVQTSALLVGGEGPAIPGVSNKVESYNGTSWSNETNYPSATYQGGIAGASEVVVTAGGQGPGGSPGPTRAESYNYDGSSWTANPNLNTTRDYMAGFGIQTSALICGGSLPPGGPANYANVEEWDGTTWTEIADLSSARRLMGSAGTAPSGMVFGGDPGTLTLTEEFNKSANVITAAAWASGPALGTGRYSGVSGGTTTAAILAGGGYPRDKNETELYDGTSWSEVNNMNSGRGRLSGTGTPSSAVGAGGYTPGSYSSAAEQWDGTNWSNITSLPQGRQYMGSIGASGSAALFIGGNSPGTTQTNETLYWNGSSWATGGNYPNTVWNPRGFGTISAGISCGGNNGPTTSSNSYNGSSWTSGPSLNIARDNCGASGATDGDGLIYGGGSDLTAEKWDGTSFATSASFANSHNGGGSNQNGSSSTAMIFGDAPAGTAFEEFTAETSALNVKTLTQS